MKNLDMMSIALGAIGGYVPRYVNERQEGRKASFC